MAAAGITTGDALNQGHWIQGKTQVLTQNRDLNGVLETKRRRETQINMNPLFLLEREV